MLVRPRPRPLAVLLLALACGDSGSDDELAEGGESGSEGPPTSSSETEAGSSESETSSSETTTTTESETGVLDCTSDAMPGGGEALIEWLAAGEYAGWPSESGPHASSGPHFGTVRTFVNPCMFDSLAAGAATHPIGAVAVKELYGAGNEVEGHSAMIKVAEGEGGDTWYWLEHYQGNTYADEVGAGLCTGCHGGPGNLDGFLSPWPLQ